MLEFATAYQATLDHEGSYSNDPADKGGETWKGISRASWPLWKGWKIIDETKQNVLYYQLKMALNLDEELEEATQKFYLDEFWNKLNLDSIADKEVSGEIFDTAVNQGLHTGARFFQQALNLLNHNGKHYSDIKADGDIGPATIKAYNGYMLTAHFPGRDKGRNIRTLLKVMNWLQMEKYVEICEANPEQEVFMYGWMNRV